MELHEKLEEYKGNDVMFPELIELVSEYVVAGRWLTEGKRVIALSYGCLRYTVFANGMSWFYGEGDIMPVLDTNFSLGKVITSFMCAKVNRYTELKELLAPYIVPKSVRTAGVVTTYMVSADNEEYQIYDNKLNGTWWYEEVR